MSCRFTHVYPDGPAPYYTVLAPARRGEEVEQWAAIKAAVSDALIAEGATITHHHAVGRDHRPWYDRQRPDVFAAALRGAKAAVDPAGRDEPRRAGGRAPVKIAVLGPGGVGGLVAGALARERPPAAEDDGGVGGGRARPRVRVSSCLPEIPRLALSRPRACV